MQLCLTGLNYSLKHINVQINAAFVTIRDYFKNIKKSDPIWPKAFNSTVLQSNVSGTATSVKVSP